MKLCGFIEPQPEKYGDRRIMRILKQKPFKPWLWGRVALYNLLKTIRG